MLGIGMEANPTRRGSGRKVISCTTYALHMIRMEIPLRSAIR
jgi:hypothetical protein